MYPKTKYVAAGEQALVVEFGNEISPEICARVRSMQRAVEGARIDGLTECVPTYRSLLVLYNPLAVSLADLQRRLEELEADINVIGLPAPVVTEIPTSYGGEYGPDLNHVAAHTGLTPDEVVRLHSSVDYLVYMLGFTVGYPYLGGMPERLATPRLKKPRSVVPAGSVGIAGPQTGVYPVESPGGWQLIGRTPVSLYDPLRDPPVLLRAGDYVRFVPITPSEFKRIRSEVESGTYVPRVYPFSRGRATAGGVPSEPSVGVPPAAGVTGGPPVSAAEEVVEGLEVLQGGFLTTVQDLGRFGFQQYGMPPSGTMDRFSMAVANILVGNPPTAAGLEITYLGPTIRAIRPVVIAVTGAEFSPTVNGRPVQQWESFLLNEGDVLEFGTPLTGCRGYIAVAGGVAVPPVMGSRSTCLRARTGGIDGRRLAAGDRIPCLASAMAASSRALSLRRLPDDERPSFSHEWRIRAVPGPQVEYFTHEGLGTLFSSAYVVVEPSDRMGLRLKGSAVQHSAGADIISDGIPPGAVQVPGDGQPIVMLADRQTTGGYPKAAVVIGPDLDLLGQARVGDTVRFEQVTLDEAYRAVREYHGRLDRIARRLATEPRREGGPGRTFRITVAGRVYDVHVEEVQRD